ncbi:MAG: hypothetical protein EXR79_06305 [Myxococcales bacterium]|nr:hypothetical protein [Myxococcales bacterium]
MHGRTIRTAILACLVATGCGDAPKPAAATPDVAPSDSASSGGKATVDAGPDLVGSSDASAPDGMAGEAQTDADSGVGSGGPALAPDHPDCDPLQPFACALPWPSNHYLVADVSRKTGFRLQFGPLSLPVSDIGKRPLPADYATLDGYSVGTSLLVHFPGIDVTGLASETNPAPSLAKDAKIVLLEVKGGKVTRTIPHFVEADGQENDPTKRVLFVRPLVILDPATRYVVGMRGLQDMAGKPFAPSAAFQGLRDAKTAGTPLAGRQQRFDDLFLVLEGAGWKRSDLLLAWDFVTNSDEAMHAPLLAMRSKAFVAVGPKGPELTVTSVISYTKEQNVDIAWEVTGTMRVPHFLDKVQIDDANEAIAYRFHLGPDGLPDQSGYRDATFWVRIPHSAKTGAPHGLVQYGHGLNGSGAQVRGGFNGRIANQNQLIFYAADMIGMSDADVGAIVISIFDMKLFPQLPERVHQGLVEWVLLQRAMRERFADLPEIQALGVKVNKQEMFYSGISQGGIYGAPVVALSQDVTRAHLGVPGNNYSLLLHRSVDFEDFFGFVKGQYPATVNQALLLSTIQLLWDRVDPVTYYRHLSLEPYPGTPKHEVLLASATGDFQVALLTNEIAARSGVGVALMKGYGKPVFGVDEVPFPHKGSGLVNYRFGNAWPVPGNLPPGPEFGPTCADNKGCKPEWDCKSKPSGPQEPKVCTLGDPHGKPRKLDHHSDQMVHFFRSGEIKDVCGGDGCTPQ